MGLSPSAAIEASNEMYAPPASRTGPLACSLAPSFSDTNTLLWMYG